MSQNDSTPSPTQAQAPAPRNIVVRERPDVPSAENSATKWRNLYSAYSTFGVFE